MPRPFAAMDVFRAIADPTRRAILDRLGGSEQSVSQLTKSFTITQPALSQHLHILREAGLVAERTAGRHRLYRATPAPLRTVAEWIARHHRL